MMIKATAAPPELLFLFDIAVVLVSLNITNLSSLSKIIYLTSGRGTPRKPFTPYHVSLRSVSKKYKTKGGPEAEGPV
jgi:hypothetical protein